MKFIGLIPARSGSTRLPGKNLLPIAGKPLIDWTIKAAIESSQLSDVYVSTDSEEIANVARKSGAQVPFLRPSNLATSEASTQSVIQNFIKHMNLTKPIANIALVLLQPTSPLRLTSDIDQAIEFFKHDSTVDSLLSCTRLPSSLHPRKLIFSDLEKNLLQTKTTSWAWFARVILGEKDLFIRNGSAIYISRLPGAFKSLVYGKTKLFHMPYLRSIDIDDEDDFAIAEHILRNRA
jgi:CMP-N-acetylneuraminic acid synthetase